MDTVSTAVRLVHVQALVVLDGDWDALLWRVNRPQRIGFLRFGELIIVPRHSAFGQERGNVCFPVDVLELEIRLAAGVDWVNEPFALLFRLAKPLIANQAARPEAGHVHLISHVLGVRNGALLAKPDVWSYSYIKSIRIIDVGSRRHHVDDEQQSQ